MARIHTNLTIDPAPCTVPAFSLSIQGHISTSFAHLQEVFGAPQRTFSATRDLGMWVLDTPAGRAHLTDHLGIASSNHDPTDDSERASEWLIVAAADAVLPWIYKVVTGSTASFVTGARQCFAEATLASFASAYVDYMFHRMTAASDARSMLDRGRSDFWTVYRLPQQFNTMALEVAEVVNHYRWWHASAAERRAWASVGRPVRRHGQPELEFWRQRNQWLYSPVTTAQYPHGGDPDLAGMLRRLADRRLGHRARLREVNPDLDFVLDEEHQQTLRALAVTPIPGLDALAPFTR